MSNSIIKDNLKLPVSLNRRHSGSHRRHVLEEFMEGYPDVDPKMVLPPILFRDVESLSNEEMVLLDNFLYVYKWFRNIE